MRNPFRKISEMSIPGAIITAGVIIGLSIFFTVYIFFGGINNRSKLFLSNPPRPTYIPPTVNRPMYPTPTQTQPQQQVQVAPKPTVATTTVKTVKTTR